MEVEVLLFYEEFILFFGFILEEVFFFLGDFIMGE